jgi:predicted ATPase
VGELPAGTVTFLFTDVEGSTRLLHELGDGYAEVLAEHRQALRAAFARHGGVEVDTQGDAFFVAFARASEALAAAAEAHEALGEGPIRVRIGVHTGEPVVTDEGYVGIDVHRAARIAAVGYGGQTLVSQSTRNLAGADSLRDLGEHRLKDLLAPERIYQLGDGDFPPLKSLNTTNLPVASSSLVGRERELAELQALLRDSARLVTLTGAGGSGKTRLGLQVAAELIDDFPGGVFFVPPAGVGQPDLVPSAITGTLGIRELADLRDREALLLVDNFEHLLDAASAVGALMRAAQNTKVIVTSRAPLRLEGEHEYPVDPLPSEEALELLTQRARAVRADFEPDAAAREICRRLDGLPLALELVASRLRSLGAQALLERLDRRLPVLTGGRRDAPKRQRTLRAAIEWSYDLLAEDLQHLLARLGVFAGTFSLEAAETVSYATFEDVDSLVEWSLLKAVAGDRFLMLETIREFALGRLEASGERDDIQRRHAEYFLAVAQSANLTNEAEGEQRHDVAIRDGNNFRAALRWTIDANEIELGLWIAVALENYAATNAPLEWRGWLSQLLACAGDLPGDLRARALRMQGGIDYVSGEYEKGTRFYEEALTEYRRLGDERGIGIMTFRLAIDAQRRGDLRRARDLVEDAMRLHRKVGFAKGEAQALSSLGALAYREGNEDVGFELLERSAALCEQSGFTWWRVNVLLGLAERLLERRRLVESEERARETLPLIGEMNDRLHAVYALALLARLAACEGRPERAGRLWGAIEGQEAQAPIPQWEEERDDYAHHVVTAGSEAFELARADGRLLTFEEALEYASRSVD